MTEASAHPGTENAAEFAWQRDDVFGRIASRYDLLSLGIVAIHTARKP